MTTHMKECVVCGGEFAVSGKGTVLKTMCSTKCRLLRDAERARKKRARLAKVRVRPSIMCVVCGNEFIPAFTQKTCSPECSHKNLCTARNKHRALHPEGRRASEMRYRRRHPEKIKEKNRRRNDRVNAAIMLVREIQEKGLEALQ